MQFTKSQQRFSATLFGGTFILILLLLALEVPSPAPFQYTVCRIVLALAAAGAAATIPGFINVEVGSAVRAGGAMAVFVVVYFFSPAQLLVTKGTESDTMAPQAYELNPEENVRDKPTPTPDHLKGELEVDITIDVKHQPWLQSEAARLYREEFPNGRDCILTYRYERSPMGVVITPEIPYLSAHAEGGPVEGIFALSRKGFLWDYPRLSLKLSNNTEETIFLTEMLIEVHDSKVNTEPVLVFGYRIYRTLSIRNEGWGKVIKPSIRFGLSNRRNASSIDIRTEELPHHIEGDTFETLWIIDMEDYLPIDQAAKIDHNSDGNVREVILPPTEMLTFGEMTYSTEEGIERSLWFKTSVDILYHPFLGASTPPTAIYQLLPLKAGDSGYTKRVPISQALKTGEADHFLLEVGADKSGYFDFSLSFYSTKGKIQAQNRILLDLYIPRSDTENRQLRDLEDLTIASSDPATSGEPESGPEKPQPVRQITLSSAHPAYELREAAEKYSLTESKCTSLGGMAVPYLAVDTRVGDDSESSSEKSTSYSYNAEVLIESNIVLVREISSGTEFVAGVYSQASPIRPGALLDVEDLFFCLWIRREDRS